MGYMFLLPHVGFIEPDVVSFLEPDDFRFRVPLNLAGELHPLLIGF